MLWRRASCRVLVAAAMLAGALPVSGQPQSGLVGLLVAPFAGDQPIAAKAATVLQLQIWQTLRLMPPNNVHNLRFGKGIVQWAEWTPPTLHSEAIAQLSRTVSQMVLWGRVQPLGKGVIVQAYLSALDPGPSGVWSIRLPELGPKETIGVRIPSAMFEFAPIELRLDMIPLLNSQIGTSPANVPVYGDPKLTRRIGVLGDDFLGLQHGPDFSKVRVGTSEGWIGVPGLSGARSELSDFAGALIRMYRRDWGGAIDLFEPVTRRTSQPVSIRVPAYLMMAAASRLLHEQTKSADRSLEFVQQAERLNPYLRETVKYKCMALLVRRSEEGAIRQLDATVKAAAYLFPKGDPWLAKVTAVVARHPRQ